MLPPPPANRIQHPEKAILLCGRPHRFAENLEMRLLGANVVRGPVGEPCGLTISGTVMSGLNYHFLIPSNPFFSWF